MKRTITIILIVFTLGFSAWFFFYPAFEREVEIRCITTPCEPIIEVLTPYKLFINK
ncbi:MAG: hypothetical protein ACI88L_000653 [Candidatus Paceibacteria bacterium]|jgi:hypothetical protein